MEIDLTPNFLSFRINMIEGECFSAKLYYGHAKQLDQVKVYPNCDYELEDPRLLYIAPMGIIEIDYVEYSISDYKRESKTIARGVSGLLIFNDHDSVFTGPYAENLIQELADQKNEEPCPPLQAMSQLALKELDKTLRIYN